MVSVEVDYSREETSATHILESEHTLIGEQVKGNDAVVPAEHWHIHEGLFIWSTLR